MRRVLCLALVAVAAATAFGVSSARAEGPPAGNPGLDRLLGVVQPYLDWLHAATGVSGFGKLRYHNGPVMHTNRSYSIYWIPAGYSVGVGYTQTVDQYFNDVAADSGKTSNVYYTGTQYTDTTGRVAYSSSYGGSVVDTTPFPANGCTDSYTTVCLSDGQLQTEIKAVVARQGWSVGPSSEVFMFTPNGVGSCSGSSCAFSQYCAYHGWIGSGASEILYANQPYTMTVPSACDSKQHPNGNDADPTINVVSHEHNETITDPNGNAWYDLFGYENGDKCAWNFGTALGSTSYGQYNQLINGHQYYLQQEFSNARNNCVLTGT